MGSAAGGGFPQWNCGCAHCLRARAGDDAAVPRTQVQFAAGGPDGYLLIGASPDLRAQILATAELTPRARRDSPIAAVVLLNGDIDGITGLLTLREGHSFTLYAPPAVLRILAQNSVFDVLDPARVPRVALLPQQAVPLPGGLQLCLLELPGKVPLYQETANASLPEPAPVYAARVANAAGRAAIFAPSCARLDATELRALADCDVLFFDGTVYHDDELIAAGLSHKSGRRMGHVPLAGTGGSLQALGGLGPRLIYAHINNSNPILCADSAESRAVRDHGADIAQDGMRIDL